MHPYCQLFCCGTDTCMDRCITNDSWHRFIFIRNGGRKYENRMLRCSSERDRFLKNWIFTIMISVFMKNCWHMTISCQQRTMMLYCWGKLYSRWDQSCKMQEYGIRYVLHGLWSQSYRSTSGSWFWYDSSPCTIVFAKCDSRVIFDFAMMLLRNTAYTTIRTSFKDFRVDEQMFSREIRNCTVGIIGTGRIGLTEAVLFKD